MLEFVGEVMSRGVVVVASETSALEVARLMRDEGVADVLIEADGLLWGIASEHDMTVRLLAAGLDPASTPVALVADSIVHTVAPDQEIHDVLQLMRAHGLWRLPVTDHGDIVGIVTLGDLALHDSRRLQPSPQAAEAPT